MIRECPRMDGFCGICTLCDCHLTGDALKSHNCDPTGLVVATAEFNRAMKGNPVDL